MTRRKDSTKTAMLHGLRQSAPPPKTGIFSDDSAERAMTEFPNASPTEFQSNPKPIQFPKASPLEGIKFAIILDGEIIQSPRQLTNPMYDSWAKLTSERMHEFYIKNQRPSMSLNWVFKKALIWWIDAMYARNDPDSFD